MYFPQIWFFPKLIFLRILNYTINVRITRKTSHRMFLYQNDILISTYVSYIFNFVDFRKGDQLKNRPMTSHLQYEVDFAKLFNMLSNIWPMSGHVDAEQTAQHVEAVHTLINLVESLWLP